jgi:hypothetical protein
VRRVHIPKGDGKQTRPIGIPTFEDKVLQRAVAMVLEAVYEQDFLDCRRNRHRKVKEQWHVLSVKLRGHYGYFGITGNSRALWSIHWHARQIWRKWLDRRSQRNSMPWERMDRLLERYPLPQPRIVHSWSPA